MRVLLVEDCDDLRQLFARMLQRRGFTVHEAYDGQDALDRVGDFEPDVVLTDAMMPRLDGFSLIRRLRDIPTLIRVPMVVISADGSPEHEQAAREAGASDFITKPVDMESLTRRLERCRRDGSHRTLEAAAGS